MQNKLTTDALKFDPHVVIGASVPQAMVDAIDHRADSELMSRSAWLRRTIFNALEPKGR